MGLSTISFAKAARLALLSLLLGGSLACAGDRDAHHMLVAPEDQFPAWQQLGLMYGAQWFYYASVQGRNIRENGSISRWPSQATSPHFDKDFYDYNLILHTMTGAGYYGYYRAFGNSRARSFALSATSVLLFEFTIESLTERPSFQDIYQTPVLGSIVGMGMEDLSLLCLESDWAVVRGLGRVLNPFTMVPGSAWEVTFDRKRTGGRVALPF